ncbi:beta-galactosidase [Pelagibacterium lentulum]|uniref:Beta-galactosidase n=1 Tax=Pelagibacterium lentulum TaxID=2029865 RepID=A0A916RJH4_9HYPH|nr:beta-galactosidase [Pelagibacterium lentulum]GGA59708.1 beta-galactosidase [Pelagibacterium lentulum]
MKRALGVCYYPEHWPEEKWAEDAALMARTGLVWVRIGEFAWSRLEPQPGQLDFAWLDRAIETLGAAGLKVVLGTPTATPPRWMLDQHPDMLAVDREGRTRKFGSRRHYCFSHIGYRKACARIVTLLAERYGRNRHVAAWQTDNEYGCHDTVISYSDAARAEFRNWLAQRYQSPQALNRAWGNVFWSMDYESFEQIDLPNLTVCEANPAHEMAFRRFSSDQVVSFNRLQTEILRRHTDAPIIHNYMSRYTDFDHFDVGADLDIASWDSYPLGHLITRTDASEEDKKHYLRQGDPDNQAFHHDLYRAVGKGRWWIMEQQPGPVNWADYNPAPLPGMARLWAWEAFAHGAEAVCYFRWRQAPFAQEQMHAGLLRPDSEPAPALAEAAQVAQELADMPEVETGKADAAIIFDYPSAWAWSIQPQGKDFDYVALVFAYYRAMRQLGLNIDIVPASDPDIARYKLVAIPGLMTVPERLSAQLERFEGVVLAGPRTGCKTEEFSIPVPLPPALPGLDTRVAYVESLPPDAPVALEAGGHFMSWREKLEGSAEALERCSDGWPALVGSGRMFYVGGWGDRVALSRIVGMACRRAGIETLNLPRDVRVRTTATHRFYFNYGGEQIAFAGNDLAPGGVGWERL